MEKSKISALLITFNEEKNILDALKTVDFADEIIVIDSYSTDKTQEIIKKNFPRVKIFENHFENFSKQRNFAVEKANFDWILFIDADERIPQALQQEILQEVQKPDAKDVYFFKRKFFYEKQPVGFSGTQNDKNIRLFKKTFAHYNENKRVHEDLEEKGTIGILQNKMEHYSFNNYTEYHDKVIHYAKLKAIDLNFKNQKYHFYTQFGKTIYNFFKMYFLKFGFLDGRKGVVLSYLSALTAYKTYEFLGYLNKANVITDLFEKIT